VFVFDFILLFIVLFICLCNIRILLSNTHDGGGTRVMCWCSVLFPWCDHCFILKVASVDRERKQEIQNHEAGLLLASVRHIQICHMLKSCT
jgi:hypothetical protein